MASKASVQDLKSLPSIEKLVSDPELSDWEGKLIHGVRVKIAQKLIDHIRRRVKEGQGCPKPGEIRGQLENEYRRLLVGGQKRVINATGVVLHTNLGRAPLGAELIESITPICSGYGDLEFDLEKGGRGGRTAFLEELLTLVCGGEGALVVNNCAAAVMLMLHALAANREVVISRGELVQIGGGFRIPDILAASGATLVEVGTTNMTSEKDYEKAVNESTAMLLKVFQSNFVISGHVEVPTLKELAQVSKRTKVDLMVDLGAGCLVPQSIDATEPTVSDILRVGASLVCFSGDKLLGGPQAGIIVGKAALVKKLKTHPIYRALRLGKVSLALLEKVLLSYAQGKEPPNWEFLNASQGELKQRVEAFNEGLNFEIVEGTSTVGGGTMPSASLPTYLLVWRNEKSEQLAKSLRLGDPPVVTRVEKNRLMFDLRTVFTHQEADLKKRLLEVVGSQ